MSEQLIHSGQLVALRRLLSDYGYTHEARLWMAGQLVGRKVKFLESLTLEEWRTFRNEAYPNWANDDWRVSPKFIFKLAALRNEWREKHEGQMKLF